MAGELEPPRSIAAGRPICAGCGTDLPTAMMVGRDGRWWCRGCLAPLLPPPRPPPSPPRGWRALVAELDPWRIAIALARAGGYAAALLICSRARVDEGSFAYACLAGAYSADNLTWLTFRLLDLPTSVTTFSLEGAIALIAGVALIHWQGAVIVPREASAFAISFAVFLAVLALKVVARFARERDA